jgi:hypothetical protein
MKLGTSYTDLLSQTVNDPIGAEALTKICSDWVPYESHAPVSFVCLNLIAQVLCSKSC